MIKINDLTKISLLSNCKIFSAIRSKISGCYNSSIYSNGKYYRLGVKAIGEGVISILDNRRKNGEPNGKIISPSYSIKNEKGDVLHQYKLGINQFPKTWKDGYELGNHYVGFDTIEEAKNAREYFLSNICKVFFSDILFDAAISVKHIERLPMVSFSTPVTNERIQKEFNLTDVEMDFIEDFGRQLNGENIDWSKCE
jgi:hypothetical protein